MAERVLGIDLGPNSIGWALIDEASEGLVAAGVRVFPEGVDNYDSSKEAPKNETRRNARAIRRQIARRARRKRKLREILKEAGLLPGNADELKAVFESDPYLLRARAVTEELTPHELGRVLYHLCQRRGFLSNRKTDRERKSETKGMLAEISELAGDIEKSGSKTLGQYLASLRDNPHERIRNRHTRRDMYEAEFEVIWESQRRFHAGLLEDSLKERVHRQIFFQRKMYWPKSVIGRCELEPREPRCARADRLAQRFRLYQELNNLSYIMPETSEEVRLRDDEELYTLLLDKLSKKKEMTFDQIRKELNLLDSVKFNLERGNRSKLQGMVVDDALAKKKLFGPSWYKKADEEKDKIVRVLIDPEKKEEEVLRLATEEWGLDAETADRLLDVDLPAGYIHLSRKALERLVPPLSRGLLYMTDDNTPSALSEAGYVRPDQKDRRVYSFLPAPPEMTNPIVRQAIFEVRKVVNAIIREYGKPDRIHIELARDAKATSMERKEISRRMRQRQEERDRAANRIREAGVKVSRAGIDRYLLWEEQKGKCVYSGEPIGFNQLFGGEVDVDHILPYSRTLDDSFQNKVVCFRSANHEKGNRSPYEWLGEKNWERFEEMLQHAAILPYAKRKRFVQKTLDLENFVARQLNDTRYISRAVSDYVRCLLERPHDVICVKGQQTATLRRLWGLNKVLRLDDTNMKNRDDHRHHAVDAIVIALTNRKRLQKLAGVRWTDDEAAVAKRLPEPWEGFRRDVAEAVNGINVSHRVSRKVSGKLHDDTFYGATSQDGEFVYRKPIETLTANMIDDIRDERVKEVIIERFQERNVRFGRGVKDKIPKDMWEEPIYVTPKNGKESENPAPIKKVRLIKRDQTIRLLRGEDACVKPGSTHHLCIFEWEEGGKRKRDAVFVTMLEAMSRLKEQGRRIQEAEKELKESGDSGEGLRKKMREIRGRIVSTEVPIICRSHPERPEARFVMSLSRGEMVLMEHGDHEVLATFISAASTSQQMWFRSHTVSSRAEGVKATLSKKPSSFLGRKVTVDPLGRIRWAND